MSRPSVWTAGLLTAPRNPSFASNLHQQKETAPAQRGSGFEDQPQSPCCRSRPALRCPRVLLHPPGPAWLVAAPTESHPPLTRLSFCVGNRPAKRRPLYTPPTGSHHSSQFQPALLVARWLCIWPSGTGVLEEGPQPSPGSGPPHPGLHLMMSREDVTPGNLGLMTLKASQWLSREARSLLRARSTEHLRPSQVSEMRGQPGDTHTERHGIHGGSGGNSRTHGRAGHGGDELCAAWPRPCTSAGARISKRGAAVCPSSSGRRPCSAVGPGPRGYEHKVQRQQDEARQPDMLTGRWTPARLPRTFLSPVTQGLPGTRGCSRPTPGPQSTVIQDGRPRCHQGLTGNSATTSPQARAVTNAAAPSRAVFPIRSQWTRPDFLSAGPAGSLGRDGAS